MPSSVTMVTVVETIKCKLGYAEVHRATPCFGPAGELVTSKPDDKNWKGVIIALICIILILTTVLFSIFIFSPEKSSAFVSGRRFEIRDILNSSFQPKPFAGSWLSGTELLFLESGGCLTVLDVPEDKRTVLVDRSVLRQYHHTDQYLLSPDRGYLLLHHHTGYTVISLHNQKGSTWDLSLPAAPSLPVQLALWSPSTESSLLVLVVNSSLYRVDAPYWDKLVKVGPVIEEGAKQGVADLLYEERIWESKTGLWFSPSGDWLAFATFPAASGGSCCTQCGGLPQAGSALPMVTISIAAIIPGGGGEVVSAALPVVLTRSPSYLTSVSWANTTTLTITLLARNQSLSTILLCPAPLFSCREVFGDSMSYGIWPGQHRPVFSDDGQAMMVRTAVREGEEGLFMHLTMVSLSSVMAKQTPITLGTFTVNKVLAWDTARQFVFFTATFQSSPHEQHVYQVSSSPRSVLSQPICLSCRTAHCTQADALLSPGFDFWVLLCLGPSIPHYHLLSLQQSNNSLLLEDHQALVIMSSSMAWPVTRHITVPMNSGKNLEARLLLPPDLDTKKTMAYPLVLNILSSPGDQAVKDIWEVDFRTFLASGLGVVVLEVDGRGSGGRGEDWRRELVGKVGVLDVDDNILALKHVISTLPYIDRSRVGVMGTNYGASLASLVVGQSKLAMCGVLTSPVVNWRYHDLTEAEEYLGFPDDSTEFINYEIASLLNHLPHLDHHHLLLVHGAEDQLVSLDQSMTLAKHLVKRRLMFQQQLYTGEGNRLQGVQEHFLHTVAAFLGRCLRLPAR